jgi:hypothetical protein
MVPPWDRRRQPLIPHVGPSGAHAVASKSRTRTDTASTVAAGGGKRAAASSTIPRLQPAARSSVASCTPLATLTRSSPVCAMPRPKKKDLPASLPPASAVAPERQRFFGAYLIRSLGSRASRDSVTAGRAA